MEIQGLQVEEELDQEVQIKSKYKVSNFEIIPDSTVFYFKQYFY